MSSRKGGKAALIRGTEYRHSNHQSYCDDGYSMHSWKIKFLSLPMDNGKKRKYRLCMNCNEVRAMGMPSKVTDIIKPQSRGSEPYQPLDDLDDWERENIKRPALELWSVLLRRVVFKLNPIKITEEEKVQCRPGVELCSCHGRYKKDCPFESNPPNKPLLTQEMKQAIKPLEPPWCDIPLPIGPRKTMMTSKDFHKRWNTIHGKTKTYLEYYSVFKTLPPHSTNTEIPKFLLEDPNDIIDGQFIQLSLDD